ncbi:MAG: leucyl aminopeptidase [Kofleriaceae bacterium]
MAAQTDLLAFVVFGDPSKDAFFRAADAAVGGALSAAAKGERFEGKALQTLSVATSGQPFRRLTVVGAGTRSAFSLTDLRELSAAIAAGANRVGAQSVALLLPSLGSGKERLLAQHAVEGVLLGAYKFDRYLTGEAAKQAPSLTSFGLLLDAKGKKPTAAQSRAITAGTERAVVVAHAVNHARNLVNEPAGVMTPTAMAAEATALAKKYPKQLTATILGPKECAKLGMGMFLAVGQGSDQEARLIHLTYKPATKKKGAKKIAIIGKGVTFDSGGYSLKPSDSMMGMKVDMAGSAAVVCAMEALAMLGCDHEVHAIAACCENLVSGKAYKLGDVLTSMDGTTVEINNTDAEGRLTLGDAITYARTKVEPDEIFDFATLTGACMVALGPYTAGVFSDHERLARDWMAAADRSGEDMWRMPLNGRLREQLKSPIADMRNTGERWGGAITAGLFLKTFAKDTPWVHVDIAGPADTSNPRPGQPKGGTGFAVATLVEYLAKA